MCPDGWQGMLFRICLEIEAFGHQKKKLVLQSGFCGINPFASFPWNKIKVRHE